MARSKTAQQVIDQSNRLQGKAYAEYSLKEAAVKTALAKIPGTDYQRNQAQIKALTPAWNRTNGRAWNIGIARNNALSKLNPISVGQITKQANGGDPYAKAWQTRLARYGPTGNGKSVKKPT